MLLFWKCLVVVGLCVYSTESSRVKRGFCSTRYLDIRNGDYRLRSGNSVVDFKCNTGYHLYGIDRAVCFGSKWSSDPPVCIANTCPTISETDTLKITKEFDGAVLKFECAALYQLKGEKTILCDGTKWSAPTPTCISWKPPVTCDFEERDLCGWSHHDKDDQDWRWNSGKTSTSRTGPSHDHTLGDGKDGHYMYFETSSPTRMHHKAILQSPLYPASYSKQACFTFWYHILGESDIGEFDVYIKPESIQTLDALNASFNTNEDRGDVWLEQVIRVSEQSEPFQILMVATRGTGYRSDFAFDDVSLELCPDASPVMSSSTTFKTTRKPTTEVVKTTRKPTTETVKTTNITTPLPTTIKTTPKKTTIKTTPKTTTIIKTSTEKPTTTGKGQTEATTTKKSVSQTTMHPPTTFQPTQKQSTTQKEVITSTLHPTYSTSEQSTQSKRTLKPIINPNLPSAREAKHIPGEDRAGPSSIVWIVLGVAIVLVIAGTAVGIIVYRRKQKQQREKLDPLCSSNPLYTAVNGGDEATVHFAAEENEGY